MNSVSAAGRQLKDVPEQAVDLATQNVWFERLARLGFIARGLVYLTVGVLALKAAFGNGGGTTDSRGAIESMASGPFGTFLLILLMVGLAGYGLWRLMLAISNPEHKKAADRIGYAISAVIYSGLALYAYRLWDGSNSGGSLGDRQTWTARLLALPAGELLVALAGAAVVAYGVKQLFKAYRASFRHELELQRLSQREDRQVTRLGRWGYSARGVVLSLMGFFLVQAALQSDPSQARGLEGALDTLAAQSYGPWLLALVAAGLLAFGAYSLVASRYRRLHTR